MTDESNYGITGVLCLPDDRVSTYFWVIFEGGEITGSYQIDILNVIVIVNFIIGRRRGMGLLPGSCQLQGYYSIILLTVPSAGSPLQVLVEVLVEVYLSH